ncbi:unnamed protein product [Schistosoma curassoni]|nr:unnamed protein product [Schistosoma curassoni]
MCVPGTRKVWRPFYQCWAFGWRTRRSGYISLFETSRYRNLVLLIRNQSKSVNHTCDQNMTSAKKQPYVNPRIRGISGDDEKEVLRKLQLLCRYDSEKRLQTNGKKQLGRHYKN